MKAPDYGETFAGRMDALGLAVKEFRAELQKAVKAVVEAGLALLRRGY